MRLKLNLPTIALGAMILIIVGIAWIQASSAASPDPEHLVNRCGSCHRMETEVAGWRLSTHAEVACTACHADKGVWGWMHMQTGQRRMEVVARWNGAAAAGEIDTEVPDRRCVACHAAQMPFVMQDLDPPVRLISALVERSALPPSSGGVDAPPPMPVSAGHDLHLSGQPQARCTDCHAGVAHGPRPGVDERAQAFHETCQACHDQQQVRVAVTASVSCAACHIDLDQVTPADHRDDWRRQHGDAVNRQQCGDCHLADSAGPHGPLARPAVFVGPTRDACATCHGLPMPHPAGWRRQHDAAFRADPGVCARCHGTAGQGFDLRPAQAATAVVNTAFCQGCHQVSLPHPPGFRAEHGQEALRLGTGTCATCHSPQNPVRPTADHAAATFCTGCHAGVSMPHPQGFLVGHGGAAQAMGADACATCHSPQNPVRPTAAHAAAGFCTDCHAGTPMPHPATYLAVHGPAAAANPATCQACHSPQNPVQPTATHATTAYCAACHDTYQHPAGWVTAHGTRVSQACATCHTAERNACSTCHTGTAWHPPYWFVQHGEAVLAQGEGACLKCHAEVEPSCTQCHRNR